MQVITGIHNAQSHSVHENICMYEQPKQKWRKAQMKEWLDSKGTIFCIHCGRCI